LLVIWGGAGIIFGGCGGDDGVRSGLVGVGGWRGSDGGPVAFSGLAEFGGSAGDYSVKISGS